MHILHRWNKWSDVYEVKFTIQPDAWAGEWTWGEQKPRVGVEYRQKRVCLKCGKVQFRKVRP